MYASTSIVLTLSDEADIGEKIRGLYGRSNMLLRKFHFCSEYVKNKLFMTVRHTVIMFIYVHHG